MEKENKLKEFLIDPSSGEYSMSRLCMGVVVLIFIPIYFVLCIFKVQVPPSIIISSLATLASVYGLNSALGSYSRNKYKNGEEESG